MNRSALATVVAALTISLALPTAPAPAAARTPLRHPALFADLRVVPRADGLAQVAGDAVRVQGTIARVDPSTGRAGAGVPATYRLRVDGPGGVVLGSLGPFTTGSAGEIAATIPGSMTRDIEADPDRRAATLAVRVIDAVVAGTAVSPSVAGAAELSLSVPPRTLMVENSFVSSVGWVKPGETYPFRVLVRNWTRSSRHFTKVRLTPVRGMRFARAQAAAGSGSARISGGAIEWSIGTMPAATVNGPTVKTLIVLGRARSLREDPRVVWRDLSTTALLTYRNGPRGGLASQSHGPKVVPPGGAFETARYGDRPFPVVPVDYADRSHDAAHTAEGLATIINSEDVLGSTFNLYQEMSYGQLYPHATIPSSAIATADFDVEWKSPRYREGGFQFSEPAPSGTCRGVTLAEAAGTPAYAERVVDGWYRLPGTTDYYGDDRFGWGAVGQVAQNALLADIDGACGPTAKSVYDAAHIADPEIDYSDFDTDKDGVVDFFMMVFVGLGGNGESLAGGTPPYDNIWPHSSSLEFTYTDPETGLKGYISDDQLRDPEGFPLYYTSSTFAEMTRRRTQFPVYVRVGPYNVNPESAVDKASVISHEYGHSLGLPDFYSNTRTDYGDST